MLPHITVPIRIWMQCYLNTGFRLLYFKKILFFNAIVNGIFLNFIFGLLIQMYRNTSESRILIMYAAVF